MANFAFIDCQNVHLGVQHQGWSLDWSRFRIYLRDKYGVTQAYIFIGYLPEHIEMYNSLKNARYILIFEPTLKFKIDNKMVTKGNVDAELVLHAMIQYPHYNQAVIVSGDGDFRCLIEYLFQQKKRKRLIVPNSKKYSRLLREFSSHITYLNRLREKLSHTKTRGIS